MEDKITRDTLLENLEVSVRLHNCLHNIYPELKGKEYREVYKTGSDMPPPKVKDFLHLSDAELLQYPNFGRKSLAEWRGIVRLVENPHDIIVEEKIAEYKALKDIRAIINQIAASHRALATHYNKLSDIISPLG